MSNWRRLGAGYWAFGWGSLGNVLEMDDVDKRAVLHPGPTIVPAALAMAHPDTQAAQLLDAIVRGYEATIRLGRAVGAGHYALWHPTGTCGPAGAAIAAAITAQISVERWPAALSLALSQSCGFWQTRHEPESVGKQLHTAHAARAGVEAALLASTDLTGPLSILEGEQGFFAAMCPGADPRDILTNYGPEWLIHQVSFKPWPACRHAHPAIDAALLAHADGGAGDVTEVVVDTYGDALVFCDRPDPATVIEAKFSLQHAVAVTLIHGRPEMAHFEASAVTDPAITALRERVRVQPAPGFEAAYPAHFGAGLTVMRDGAQPMAYTVQDAWGDPENPMPEAAIVAKARTLLIHGGLDLDAADGLVAAILALRDGGSVAAVLNPLEALA